MSLDDWLGLIYAERHGLRRLNHGNVGDFADAAPGFISALRADPLLQVKAREKLASLVPVGDRCHISRIYKSILEAALTAAGEDE